MSNYLPEEIMMQIFERLPTKSLVRFSCLSKRWNRIILSDPHFARSQFLMASQQQTLTSRFLCKAEFWYGLDSLGMEAPGVTKKMHTPFLYPGTPVRFLSFNGLVVCLVFKYGRTRLYIWNPSTGVNKEFPCPPRLDYYDNINRFGFGYVSATNDYKVFISFLIEEDGMKREEFNILSLRAANTWKNIEAPNPFDPPGHANMYKQNGTLIHEALHWLNIHNIVSFDLEKEEFRTMPLPPSVIGYYTRSLLGPSLGGCLSCLINNICNDSAELWVMREYGVADSWTRKLRKINYSRTLHSRLVLATETAIFVERLARGYVDRVVEDYW